MLIAFISGEVSPSLLVSLYVSLSASVAVFAIHTHVRATLPDTQVQKRMTATATPETVQMSLGASFVPVAELGKEKVAQTEVCN